MPGETTRHAADDDWCDESTSDTAVYGIGPMLGASSHRKFCMRDEMGELGGAKPPTQGEPVFAAFGPCPWASWAQRSAKTADGMRLSDGPKAPAPTVVSHQFEERDPPVTWSFTRGDNR